MSARLHVTGRRQAGGWLRAAVRSSGCLALAWLAGASVAANAMPTCSELVSALSRLTAQNSRELVAVPSTGRTFTELYMECDTRNTFAGRALPTHRGRPLRCSTDPNRVEFVRRYDDGTIVFRSKMAVDADGSPVSMGPDAGPTDQPETWLSFDRGSQRQYVNAEDVPFVVVPIDFARAGISFQRQSGIRKGDLAAIFANGRCSFGVVGDAGPYFRLGEGSLKSHSDLGNPQCDTAGQYPCRRLRNGGQGAGIGSGVTFVIFPSTRPSPLLSETVVAVADTAARNRVRQFLSRYAP